MEKSADDLEFSAEGLSGNAKTTKFALLEPALQFVTFPKLLLIQKPYSFTLCYLTFLELLLIQKQDVTVHPESYEHGEGR